MVLHDLSPWSRHLKVCSNQCASVSAKSETEKDSCENTASTKYSLTQERNLYLITLTEKDPGYKLSSFSFKFVFHPHRYQDQFVLVLSLLKQLSKVNRMFFMQTNEVLMLLLDIDSSYYCTFYPTAV